MRNLSPHVPTLCTSPHGPMVQSPARTLTNACRMSCLERKIAGLGGFVSAHLHVDRAGTYDDTVSLLQDDDRAAVTDEHSVKVVRPV